MRQTLRKGEVLRGYGSFKSVLESGRVYRGKKLRIFIVFSPPGQSVGGRPLVGFGVGRKAGSAVVRNRLKRLMREVIRRNKSFFHECCQEAAISRLLLMCTPPSHRSDGRIGPSYRELESEFRTLMEQASHR